MSKTVGKRWFLLVSLLFLSPSLMHAAREKKRNRICLQHSGWSGGSPRSWFLSCMVGVSCLKSLQAAGDGLGGSVYAWVGMERGDRAWEDPAFKLRRWVQICPPCLEPLFKAETCCCLLPCHRSTKGQEAYKKQGNMVHPQYKVSVQKIDPEETQVSLLDSVDLFIRLSVDFSAETVQAEWWRV